MALHLHLARPEEIAAAGLVTKTAYVDDGYMPADEPYTEHLADAARRAAEAELWVAVDEDQPDEVLGCVTFCPPGSPWREISSDGEAEFRMLAVAPAARGHGIGEALVRHCVERARAFDQHVMVLSTMDKMAAAHRLYERLGFRRLPERDWEPVPGVRLLAYRTEI